jgi:alpha-tubulin suppressor-like RCC1 family protein
MQIFSSGSAFAALKADGSVVTWGADWSGGDSSGVAGQLSSGVMQIFSSGSAFAALKADGSVVTWGNGS